MWGWNAAYYNPKGDTVEDRSDKWVIKCDCGAEKTFGIKCSAACHYDWCSKKNHILDNERLKRHEEATRYR